MKSKIVLLSYIFLAISFFFLPLKTSISNLGIIGLLVLTIISFVLHGYKGVSSLSPSFFFKSSFIIASPICIGLIYTPDFNEALDEIIKALFLFLLPLVILRKDLGKGTSVKVMSVSLITGSLVACFSLLTVNLYEFFICDLKLVKLFSSDFTGFDFLEPLNNKLHPIYVGSYFNLALIFILFNRIISKLSIKIPVIIILLLTIIFLNSRIIFLSTFITLVIYVVHNFQAKIIVISSVVMLVFSIITFPFLKDTYIYNKAINGTVWDLQNNIGTHNTDTKTTSDSRMSRWICGWEAFVKQPLLGYGSGSETLVLMEKYKEKKMSRSVKQAYKSHNQFLSYLIKFGLLGSLLLVLFVSYKIVAGYKQKDMSQVSFFTMLLFVMLVENYLDRNMGTNLVALVITVFLINRND